MKKRILCALLAAAMLLGMIAVAPREARAASNLTGSQELVDMIKKFEGFLKYPVWDNKQYSMGYGTYCSPEEYPYYKEHGITEEEAEERLRKYMDSFGAVVNRFADKYGLTLSQQQFDALVSLSYNCGDSWVRDTGGYLHKALATGASGNELLYAFSLWSKSSSLNTKGLIVRRLAEANLYLNGVYSTSRPGNYTYVTFDPNGGTVNYLVQGYDVNTDAPIYVIAAESITVTGDDGKKEVYTFDGWYTAKTGGDKVTVLDGSLPAGTVLYAHWKDTSGSVAVPPEPEQTPISPVAVTVTGDSVNVRKGPGTGYSLAGTVAKGTKLTITATSTSSDGLRWGKYDTDKWICLRYTDFDSVSKGDGNTGGDGGNTGSTNPVTGTVISSGNLNIRSGAGTGYPVVGNYPSGTKVTILEQKTVGADKWGRTDKGWISMAYVKLDGNGGGETTKPTAPPETEPPATQPPATQPPTTEPPVTTQPPVTQPPATQPTEPFTPWKGTVTVADSLCIRSGAGTYNSIVGYLFDGAVVTILEEKTVEDIRWGRIEKGWISLNYVVKGVVEPTEPPTTQPPVTQPPTESQSPVTTGKWTGKVNATTLYVRNAPGAAGKVVGNLANGTGVTVTLRKQVEGKEWGKIDKGWICLDYVVFDGESTPVTEPTTPPTEPSVPATSLPGSGETVPQEPVTMTVNTCSLRIRGGAGVTNAIQGYVSLGDQIVIREFQTVGSVVWGLTEGGWVSLKYLKDL